MEAHMTEYRTFKSGEILSNDERAKLSPEDRKRYDREQKVRGLMALIDNPSTPEDERDTAMRMLANLITRHQIDVAALRQKKNEGPAKIVEFEIFLSNRFNLGAVRSTAIHRAVLTPLGGSSIKWWSSGQSTKTDTRMVCFVSEDVVDFAKMLIASLMLQMESSLAVAVKRHRRELEWQWVPVKEINRLVKDFRKSYIMAWGTTVGQRVAAGRKQAVREASVETGKEIVLMDDSGRSKAAQEVWHKAQYGEKAKLRSSRPIAIVSQTGVQAGARDGRTAQLGTNEVGGTRRARITA
jgi:hypothetical protein